MGQEGLCKPSAGSGSQGRNREPGLQCQGWYWRHSMARKVINTAAAMGTLRNGQRMWEMKGNRGQNNRSAGNRHCWRNQPLLIHSPDPLGATQKLPLSMGLPKSNISWPSVLSHCTTKSHPVFTRGEGEEQFVSTERVYCPA